MILGPIGNGTEPQKPLFLNLGPQNYFNKFKKKRLSLGKFSCRHGVEGVSGGRQLTRPIWLGLSGF